MVSLKPERLKRYKDVAMLMMKYGRSDLVKQAGLEDSVELDESWTKLFEVAGKFRSFGRGLLQIDLVELDAIFKSRLLYEV